MITMIVTTTILAVLYGLAWHNEPSRISSRVMNPGSPRRLVLDNHNLLVNKMPLCSRYSQSGSSSA